MAKRSAQLDAFADFRSRLRAGFGGEKTRRSNPTGARPFSPRLPAHIILKSSLARGERSLFLRGRAIDRILNEEVARQGGKLHDGANSGNHLHLLVQFRRPESLRAFLRAISGRIARLVLGSKKGTRVLGHNQKFWDARPWSRLVSWGRDFANVRRYALVNAHERMGMSRAHSRAMIAELERIGGACFGVGPPLRPA